jgi:AraC-like DNA-binding protein
MRPPTSLSARYEQWPPQRHMAIALQDDSLGFTLARDFDPRALGLLYYVMASSQTLGDALKRVARYSQTTNEALVVRYREGNRLIINLSYSGVPRHSDRHQIEFCMFAVLRICRVLTGQNLVPQHFSISHHRSGANSEMARFVGTKVEFGADMDEFSLNANARELPLIHADAYLNNLLLKYYEAALSDRRGNVSQLRTRVENAISSLLPHGRVVVDDVARSLGMSKRTLARKLSDEGLNFTEVLQQLRRDLAVRYLDDPKLHISKIAWLLGFNEVMHSRTHSSGGPERRRARCVQPPHLQILCRAARASDAGDRGRGSWPLTRGVPLGRSGVGQPHQL